MRAIINTYGEQLRERAYQKSLILSACFFIASMALNFYAIGFATTHASNSVSDIILSNTPVFDVDGFFIYGTVLVAAVSAIIALAHPRGVPFALYTVGLFWIIRSLFVMMTHIAPFESYYASEFSPTITRAFFGKDQFFSAHTGMPFLGALAFWSIPRLRAFFLAASLYFAVVVLLGHLHYTIDVMSAFFITYGIYSAAVWAFPREYELFERELDTE